MNILGIHFDFPFIKISRIRKSRKGIDVFWTKTATLAPADDDREENSVQFANVKQLYISNFRGKVVSGLPAKDFLIRPIDVKIASKKHVEEAIAFQSEALSHFKPGEVIAIPMIEKREKGKVEGLLFTIPRDSLQEHLEELQKWEIDPDCVSTVPSALCHFIKWKFPALTDALIVDLGSSMITIALLENGKLKKSHAIPMGIEDLLASLYEDRKRILLKNEIEGAAKQIDLLLLKSHLNPRLSEELTALRQELAKIHLSFTRNLAKPVIFTGRSDAFLHLREFLIDFSPEEWPLTIEEQKSAVSLGLCIEQSSNHPIQLRREEFFPRKNWSRMGLIALLLLAISSLLSTALVWYGKQSAERSKEQMLNALQTPLRKDLLSGESMEEQIDRWIQMVEKNNQEYPYILKAPRVSEILFWLSSHPLLEELKREGDPIDIWEIHTQLVSYPSIHSEKEGYLEKVELIFGFKSMMNARKFHEALREGDEWVDPQKEVTWDAMNDGYRTSFYLKNRSPYVP